MSKYEVVDEQDNTRNAAERLTRRAKRSINGGTQHFYLDPQVVEDLSKEGHLAWLNDDLKGSLLKAQDLGYRFVTNREAYGPREDLKPEDRAHVRHGIADKQGNPQDIYLMLQPWPFYKEDKQILEDHVEAYDKLVRGVDPAVERSYGRRTDYKT